MQRQIIWQGETASGNYQVVDGVYDGRPARVLYSGNGRAAQSGIARDKKPDLLFDYTQRLLELAEGYNPKAVLMIGGAAGTLPKALLEMLPQVRVDSIEPDEGLTKLGYEFFELPVDERFRIFHTDGRTFLREHASRYDMIIVDAFSHATIPADLTTAEAFAAYRKHLQSTGLLAVNIISGYYGESRARVLRELYAAAVHEFGAADVFLASRDYSLWLPQNFILAAQCGEPMDVSAYTRGQPIDSPPLLPLDYVPRD